MIATTRAARPEEIADAVLFVACDESSFVTGAEPVIDGGMIIGPTPRRALNPRRADRRRVSPHAELRRSQSLPSVYAASA